MSFLAQIVRLNNGRKGTRETLDLMAALAREGSRNLSVSLFASSLVSKLPPKDYAGEVKAVHAFVRDSIRYTRDPSTIERLASPEVTLKTRAGDCDDKSTLLAALLLSLGHKVRFRAIGRSNNPDNFVHVLVDVFQGGQWVALETTEPVAVGWTPPGVTDTMTREIEGLNGLGELGKWNLKKKLKKLAPPSPKEVLKNPLVAISKPIAVAKEGLKDTIKITIPEPIRTAVAKTTPKPLQRAIMAVSPPSVRSIITQTATKKAPVEEFNFQKDLKLAVKTYKKVGTAVTPAPIRKFEQKHRRPLQIGGTVALNFIPYVGPVASAVAAGAITVDKARMAQKKATQMAKAQAEADAAQYVPGTEIYNRSGQVVGGTIQNAEERGQLPLGAKVDTTENLEALSVRFPAWTSPRFMGVHGGRWGKFFETSDGGDLAGLGDDLGVDWGSMVSQLIESGASLGKAQIDAKTARIQNRAAPVTPAYVPPVQAAGYGGGLPSWALPVGIGAAVLVGVVALRK